MLLIDTSKGCILWQLITTKWGYYSVNIEIHLDRGCHATFQDMKYASKKKIA